VSCSRSPIGSSSATVASTSFLAYEIVTSHRQTLARLRAADLRRLGGGMDSWGDVDTFACYVAGPAWRERQVPDAEIARWARSKDRWWRRAAVVSTVPLNSRARGGTGDVARTLAICRLALDDRDPMVVKALSWALRELAKRSPAELARFLDEHDARLPALARREVRSKLRTGLKTPRRRATTRDIARDRRRARPRPLDEDASRARYSGGA
jgi:3-methyladenine DNA glycosylase AlkD